MRRSSQSRYAFAHHDRHRPDRPHDAPAAPTLPIGLFALRDPLRRDDLHRRRARLEAGRARLAPGSARSRWRRGFSPSSCSSRCRARWPRLYGRATADRLVRFGFIPLITAIALTYIVIQLPTDAGMYEPAKEAFPIILGQSWRLMAAGIIAYGVSMSLNVFIFSRLSRGAAKLVAVRAAIASILSQIVDTLIFITVAFLRRPPDRRAHRRPGDRQGRPVDRPGPAADHVARRHRSPARFATRLATVLDKLGRTLL